MTNAEDTAAVRRVTLLFLQNKTAFTGAEFADIKRATAALWWEAAKTKFSPDQPRVPAGNSDGGQWMGGGGSGGGDSGGDCLTPGVSDRLFGVTPAYGGNLPRDDSKKIDDSIKHLESHAHSKPTGWCAQYVRQALNAGGIKLEKPPARSGETSAQARDFGKNLTDVGFRPVINAVKPAKLPDAHKLRRGDVVVIQATSANKAGHMAIYNGTKRISDYKQPGFWPGDAYRAEKPDYVIYRLFRAE